MSGFMEENHGRKHHQYGTESVDGCDLVDIPCGQCLKIAEPGSTGGKAGQYQEEKGPDAYGCNGGYGPSG